MSDRCGNYYWTDPFMDKNDEAQPKPAEQRLTWEAYTGCKIISVESFCSYI
jgi:hypothetical protein